MSQHTPRSLALVAATLLSAGLALAQTPVPGDRWPAFRAGNGGLTRAKLPTTWTDDGVAWTKPLPGYGQSSPVVFGGRVYVTSIDNADTSRCQVTCVRATDGHLLWSRSFASSSPLPMKKSVSRGAPTPAVDANGVYAFFKCGDLFALTHEGELRWTRLLCREYGAFQGNHGIASSLVPTDDALLILIDHGAPGYLVKIDKASGKNVWKVDRPKRVSWTTPVVAPGAERSELIISSNGVVESIAIADGTSRWRVPDIKGNTVPSPVVTETLVVVGASSKGTGNLAVRRPGGATESAAIAWKATEVKPTGFASPIVVGANALYLNKAGIVSCVALDDGKQRWRVRIAEGCWASPISDGTHVWFFGKTGKTTVLRVTEDGAEIVAKIEMPTDGTVYGVAAIDGAFFVREGRRLVRIGQRATQQAIQQATRPATPSAKPRTAPSPNRRRA